MSFPLVPLGEVLSHYQEYIDAPEDKAYPKLSVKLYGRGVCLDTPADGSLLKMKRHQLAKAGQVILSEIWGKKGAIGIVPDEGEGSLCTSHFFLFDIHPEKIEPRYLAFIFQANYLADQLGSEAFGTTGYAAVRPRNLLKATVPLPPFAEQRRIVARVEAIAERVAEARRLREEAVVEASAVLKSASNHFIMSEPNEQWIPVSTYVEEIENGWSPPCETRRAEKGEWAILKVGAVSFGRFDPFENKALPVGIEPKPEYEVRAGDFLMIRANTSELAGACAIVSTTPPKLMLSDKHFRFRFRDASNILPRYLDLALKSPALRSQIERGATGTSSTMKNISKSKVLALLIPPHTLPEQRRIVTHLDALQAKADTLRSLQSETAAELDALLPAVLAQAFAGKL